MRCYNGCPDDELAAIWDSRDKAREELKRIAESLGKRGMCTYFPLEGMYMCCDENYKQISEFHHSVESAVAEAIKNLQETEEKG